jgi:hypothetical protein
MKTTVMPGQHVLNGHIVDFSFFLKHLQDFVPEGLFKVFLMEVGRHLETAIVMETPIRDDAQPHLLSFASSFRSYMKSN